MKKSIDVNINDIFGIYKVLNGPIIKTRSSSSRTDYYYECLCTQCGSINTVEKFRLTHCVHKKCINCIEYNLPIGYRSFKLTVIDDNEYKIYNASLTDINIYYRCRCDCGNELLVDKSVLRSCSKYSCGLCNDNLYDLLSNDEYGICYIDKSRSDDFFIFDKEDYEILGSVWWHYSESLDYIEGLDSYKLHRYLLIQYNCDIEDMVVHHINGNKLDNRKCNLYICTRSEHMSIHMNNILVEPNYFDYIRNNESTQCINPFVNLRNRKEVISELFNINNKLSYPLYSINPMDKEIIPSFNIIK